MNIKTKFAIALLCLGLSVAAAAQVISLAYEIALSDFRAPATTNGSASFKECEECERHLVRVTAATRYSVDGATVNLADFRAAVASASDRDDKVVIVLRHLESDTIQSIDVSL